MCAAVLAIYGSNAVLSCEELVLGDHSANIIVWVYNHSKCQAPQNF